MRMYLRKLSMAAMLLLVVLALHAESERIDLSRLDDGAGWKWVDGTRLEISVAGEYTITGTPVNTCYICVKSPAVIVLSDATFDMLVIESEVRMELRGSNSISCGALGGITR
jgi:hypothetical protein